MQEIITLNKADQLNRFYENIPEEVYHADKRFVNSSSLKSILKSPLHYKTMLNHIIEPTKSMEFGTLVHKCVLEGELFLKALIIAGDFGDLRVKINKEKKAAFQAEHEGKIICQESEIFALQTILNNIAKHSDASSLLKNAMTEITGLFVDQETGIMCKIRPDIYNQQINALVDLKTSRDCSIEEFSKTVWNYRYDIQNAHYGNGIETITKKAPEYNAFLVIENCEPYDVALYICDDQLLLKGRTDYRRALDTIHKCRIENNWPSYQNSVQSINLPYWALNK